MTQFIITHWRTILEGLIVVATCAINSMPPLQPTSSPTYTYWYHFLHALPLPTAQQSKLTEPKP